MFNERRAIKHCYRIYQYTHSRREYFHNLNLFDIYSFQAGMQLKAVLLTLVEQLPPNSPILLLGTSFVSPDELDGESSSVFPLNTVYVLLNLNDIFAV